MSACLGEEWFKYGTNKLICRKDMEEGYTDAEVTMS